MAGWRGNGEGHRPAWVPEDNFGHQCHNDLNIRRQHMLFPLLASTCTSSSPSSPAAAAATALSPASKTIPPIQIHLINCSQSIAVRTHLHLLIAIIPCRSRSHCPEPRQHAALLLLLLVKSGAGQKLHQRLQAPQPVPTWGKE